MKKNQGEIAMQHKQMELLMQTIQCDNKDALQLIVDRALRTIHKKSFLDEKVNEAAQDMFLTLLQSINPKDTVETMLASQFIALQLKAMSAIAEDNYHIMGKAMAMLRLSQHALILLQAYRGKTQTINVNYNVLSQGNATLNTLIQTGNSKKTEEAHGVQNEF